MQALAPLKLSGGRPCRALAPRRRTAVRVQADAGAADACSIPDGWEEPPSQEKRAVLNLLLLGAVSLPCSSMLVPYLSSLVPKSTGSAGGPQAAKDALGNDVRAAAWLAAHPAGDRSLVQGLQGDATYLVVTDGDGIQDFGINSICTHLGCVVPWNAAENKFMCPCHGSLYDAQGKKVRGPAPLSLALAHVATDKADVVILSPWTEADFRDGESPWWA